MWSNLFASLAAKVTSADGDFGPEGVNIERNYIGSYTDRIMFVAVKPSSSTATITTAAVAAAASPDQVSGQVVGCLCVKRGTVEDIGVVVPESETVYSVNRVSVDATARKLKIGTKLMIAAEEWARARGATKIHLTTANEIASKFYVKLNYQKIDFWGVVHEKYIRSREESATSNVTESAVEGEGGGSD